MNLFILIFIIVIFLLCLFYTINKYISNLINYNTVIDKDILCTKNKYLNVGLWTNIKSNNTNAIINELKNSNVSENLDLLKAQQNMFKLFYFLGDFGNPKIKILETGAGTCSHYILYDKLGLQADVTIFEKYLNVDNKLKKIIRKNPNSNLAKIKHYKRDANYLKCFNKYDRIICLETAFHYENRNIFFKKCYKALKKNGKLIMTDIIPYEPSKDYYTQYKINFYSKHILKIHETNRKVYYNDYIQNLKSCGFSSIKIIDVSDLTIREFYRNFKTKNVPESSLKEILKYINNNTMVYDLVNNKPYIYPLVICQK